MLEYLSQLFSKTVMLMIGVALIRIGSIYWNVDGSIDPMMLLLFMMGALILTLWNEVCKEDESNDMEE